MIDLSTLNSLLRRIDNITHINKTDKAYYDATELAMELSEILPDNRNIKRDIKILKKYNLRGIERNKKSVIDEFKENSMHDIIGIISDFENNPPNVL
ncbi:hypothetical protein H8R23_14685 [Flavobacterium sp. F-380]|uniref:Uncharacterized protein n=1 Tax=Flavobacterium kayseriense TaxID=2764714 RepID=A0ABR7JB33_9FLAO|nr:hypothetical protein [Flavobacterium kayseriense]MBC5842657.1 hypothetical protein [Flavobacterium kayseriense]MBC5849187.1 hypothetical protein [Flavobacterium kayseriense]